VADAESDRLINLAEDLLLVARSDSGALDLDLRAVPAHELLDSVERRFRRRAGEDGRAIVVDAPAVLTVNGDVRRVEQALTNLVENSLRHGEGRIELTAVPGDGVVELHVRDEGPGLPAAFIPHAFERFSRVEPGRTGEGTGLGLAIVALVAEAHGGRAAIRNRQRGGTDAWLELPVMSSAGHVHEQAVRP
jgi:signal transduction histidine kinase